MSNEDALMIPCPGCLKPVYKDGTWEYCPACGFALDGETLMECPACNDTGSPVEAVFCVRCGQDFRKREKPLSEVGA